MIRLSILGVGLILPACHVWAQRPSFDVVSIKPNKCGDNCGGTMGPRGGKLVGTNVTLKALLMYAFSSPTKSLLEAQIVGLPNWAGAEHFDIEATGPGGARVVPGPETKSMVQSLLEDSFHLKAHTETRDLPVYNLVLAKSGPKLSADQTPLDPRQAILAFATEGEPLGPLARGTLRMVTGPTTTLLTGTAISVPRIALLLQGRSDRIIVDKSGFSGLLDVQLAFGKDLGGDISGSSDPGADQAPFLFTAIQDIGLKLVPGKAPLAVLVIDSVQRPPEN